jgi:2-polyprenyl-6-methoxyphenol hydroxylase-like FAD-dependent oxidoreductase
MLCDVAIVGAGPYGLAAASHLRQIKGLSVSIFGEPMRFWRTAMPAGMLLRSAWSARTLPIPTPRSHWMLSNGEAGFLMFWNLTN